MSRLLVTSDLHLGHKNIHKHRSDMGFESADAHHQFVFERLAAAIHPRDTVFFLGDIAFSLDWLKRIKTLKCNKKVLVMGNHDTDHCTITEIADAYDEVYSLLSHKGIWFSHAPIHDSELRGKFNFHGHTHSHNVEDSRYFNASLENTNYQPVEVVNVKNILMANLQGYVN